MSQKGAQAVEPMLPLLSVLADPFVHPLQRVRHQHDRPHTSLFSDRTSPAFSNTFMCLRKDGPAISNGAESSEIDAGPSNGSLPVPYPP